MTGFMSVLEAEEGFLLCGRTVSDGAVFDHFHEALSCMNTELEDNRLAFRKVKVAKVLEFEGMVSCWVNESDDDETTSCGSRGLYDGETVRSSLPNPWILFVLLHRLPPPRPFRRSWTTLIIPSSVPQLTLMPKPRANEVTFLTTMNPIIRRDKKRTRRR
jgi:hypothetical protein